MTDIYKLGFEIDSTDVVKADKALKDLGDQEEKTAKKTDNLTKSTDDLVKSKKKAKGVTAELGREQNKSARTLVNLMSEQKRAQGLVSGLNSGIGAYNKNLNQASASETRLTKSNERLVGAFSSLKTSSQQANFAIKGLSTGVSRASDSIRRLSEETDRRASSRNAMITDWSRYDQNVTKATRSTKRLTKSTSSLARSFKPAKNSAQQMGFQMQDVAVQAQMGTNALTILGQQGSQIGGIFGAGGAILGAVIAVSAAIGGALVKAIGSASNKSEVLIKRIDELGFEFDKLTDAQRQFLIVQKESKIKEQGKEVERLTREMAIMRDEMVPAKEAMLQLFRSGDMEGAKAARKQLRDWKKDLIPLQAQLDTVNAEIKKHQDTIDKISTKKSTKEYESQQSALKRLIDSLTQESNVLGKTGVELAAYTANSLGATEAQLELIKEKSGLIEEYEKEQQAIKDTAKEQQSAKAAADRLEATRQSTVKNTLAGLVEQEQKLAQQLKIRIDVIKSATDQELEIIGGRDAAILAAETSLQEQLSVIKNRAAQEDVQRQMQSRNSVIGLITSLTGIAIDENNRRAQSNEEGARRAFEVAKAQQKGLVAVNTAGAIMNELATNPNPLSKWLNVAGIVATGLKQAASINSATFGGGSSVSAPQQPSGDTISTTTNENQFTFNIQGGSNGEGIGQQMKGALKELFNDGYIAFDKNTEQGQILGS